MTIPKITFEVSEMFFDRDKVIQKIGRANARRLSKIGAFIRTRARTDILKRRKATSSPGRPPNVHSKDPVRTLKNILFAVDRDFESVIVGPVRLRSSSLSSPKTTVPNVLEVGGPVDVVEQSFDGKRWAVVSRVKSNRKYLRKRTANYKARPFMGPALQKEVDAGTIMGVFASVQA